MIKIKFSGKFIFVAVLLGILLAPLSAYTEETKEKLKAVSQPAEDTQGYIQQLEKRISDLEAIVNTLLKEKKVPPPAPSGEVPKEKTEAPPAAEDEWAEPVVETEPVKGRDEDARRRIIEIETWRKKLDAKAAKESEEDAEKVKWDISGNYKVRLNIKNNLFLDNPGQFSQYDNTTYLDQRFQLRLDASYRALSGLLLLDKGNFLFDWKEDTEGTLDRWSEFHTVNAALVRELWAQYTGDVIFKVGRQTLFVGNDGLVIEGPVDALKLTYPIGKTPLGMISASLAYIAVSGGHRNYTNFTYPAGDRSSVFGIANKLDGWLLSLDIKPKKGLTVEPYILKVFDRGKAGHPDLNLDKDFNIGTTSRDGGFEPLWIGAAISGKEGNLSYKADLIYLTGSYTNTRNINANAFLLSGDYDFKEAGLSAGLEVGRGSGNKAGDSSSDNFENFSGLFLCKDRRKFGNIFSEDLRAGYFLWDSNLANVTFLRAIADFEPVKKMRTSIALAKFWTTESVYKGRGPVSNWWDWSRGTSATLDTTKDIGWEIDANINYPLYRRLKGFVELGYFIPGDVYQQADGKKADPASEIVIGAEFEF